MLHLLGFPQFHRFRPRIGDYFFIDSTATEDNVVSIGSFPSPYWGLIFYHNDTLIPQEIYVGVSVPILGIIFLS